MPSVVRIAEQRVGRIDRMDSPHARVESWWPSDAEEFALATDELLEDRLELVGDVLGSNLELPEGKAEVVPATKMVEEVERHEREQVQLLTDAFAPVRGLVEGEAALVERGVYEAVRRSKARVLSAVSVVRMPAGVNAWGFFAIAGTKTTAPRWAFVDGGAVGGEGDGAVATDLGVVAGRLRERLVGVEDVELDDEAMAVMTGLLERLERGAIGLLPRRKRRALAQMEEVLAGYGKAARKSGDAERVAVCEGLLGVIAEVGGGGGGGDRREGGGGEGGGDRGGRRMVVDLEDLVDRWLAVIRPRWRAALAGATGRRRNALRRLSGVTRVLVREGIGTGELVGIAEGVRRVEGLAGRVVAAIVGVVG